MFVSQVLPYFHMAPSPATPGFSHAVLLPTILDWLHSQGLQGCCAGSGPAAVLGTNLVQAVGCDAGVPECPVLSPEPPPEEGHCMGTAVGEGLHCKPSMQVPCQQAVLPASGPPMDSVSLKSLFTSSLIW